jgi:UDP-N-acetyl-D-mannosaminuronic acid dehydrogenase
MRGTPIATMMPIFVEAGITVLGHDPMVTDDVIREYGGQPASLERAFCAPDGVLVINDHPDYRAIDVPKLLVGRKPAFVYDSWRVLDETVVTAHGVRYAGLGYLPASEVSA